MDSFIGRDREQRAFTGVLDLMLASDGAGVSGEGRLVLVSGHGGIGKSTLLRRFESVANGESGEDIRFRGSFLAVRLDFDDRTSGSVITDIAGPPFEHVLARLADAIISTAAGRRRRRMASSAFDGFRNELAGVIRRREGLRSAGRLGGDAGARPGRAGQVIAGSTVEGIVGMTPAAGFARSANELVTVAYGRVADAFANSRNTRDVLREFDDAAAACRGAFAEAVRKIASEQPIVIILDTCELLGPAAEVLCSLMPECGPHVCWVVGVRLEPEREAAADSDTMRYRRAVGPERVCWLELAGFDKANVNDYLRRQSAAPQLADGDVADVLRLTRGVPLAVALVATMLSHGASLPGLASEIAPSDDAARIVRDLAERYLRHVSNLPGLAADLPLLQGIALLPDEAAEYGLLGALWGMPEQRIHAQMRALARRHDFVFSGRLASPGAVMHQEIRDTLRRTMRDPDQRASVTPMNERAISYLHRRLRACALESIERQLSQNDQDQHVRTWQSSALALLWHTFWVDTAAGVALIRHLYPPAAVLAPAFADAQGRIARFHLGTPGVHAQRLLRFLAVPPVPSTPDESTRALDELGAAPIADGPYAKDIPHDVYYRLMRISHARNAGTTGFASRMESVRDASRLIKPLQPQIARMTHTAAALADEAALLGVELSKEGAYESAIGAFNIELLWRPDDARAHGHMALAHAALGNSDAAARSFRKATTLDPGNSAMHAAFGELMILAGTGDEQGRCEALDWAIRQAPTDDPNTLLLRGLVTRRLTAAETHEEASGYFTRALDAASGMPGFPHYEIRSIARAALGDTAKAVEEFDRGIPHRTPTDKYRKAIYQLLGSFNHKAAQILIDKWQDITRAYPEASRPWG